jgi:hypothetical protein
VKSLSQNDINGVNLTHATNLVFHLTLNETQVLDLSVSIPFGGRDIPNNQSVSGTDIKLDECTDFMQDFDACFPFPHLNLLNRLYPLNLSKALGKSAGDYKIQLQLTLKVLECEDFEPLYDTRRFEGAIDRSIYTQWGPGAFRHDYDSALNRKHQTINGVDWITFETRYRDSSPRQRNFQHIRSCYAVINQRYILEFDLVIQGQLSQRLIPHMQSLLDDLQPSFIASTTMQPNESLKQAINEQRSNYSQQYRADESGPVKWVEEPIPSLPEIESEIDFDDLESTTLLEDLDECDTEIGMEHQSSNEHISPLIYSPYRAEDQDKIITPPWDLVKNMPNGEKWIAQCRNLIEQMKKSFASHVEFE